jgi:hypothetical protein
MRAIILGVLEPKQRLGRRPCATGSEGRGYPTALRQSRGTRVASPGVTSFALGWESAGPRQQGGVNRLKLLGQETRKGSVNSAVGPQN